MLPSLQGASTSVTDLLKRLIGKVNEHCQRDRMICRIGATAKVWWAHKKSQGRNLGLM
jgi:hypothetical protein